MRRVWVSFAAWSGRCMTDVASTWYQSSPKNRDEVQMASRILHSTKLDFNFKFALAFMRKEWERALSHCLTFGVGASFPLFITPVSPLAWLYQLLVTCSGSNTSSGVISQTLISSTSSLASSLDLNIRSFTHRMMPRPRSISQGLLVVEHNFFFFVPRSVSKLAASAQALITLGSPSPHLAHLSSLSNLSSAHYSLTHWSSIKLDAGLTPYLIILVRLWRLFLRSPNRSLITGLRLAIWKR